jgi:hypothetical protein
VTLCAWCDKPCPPSDPSHPRVYCSKRCRQTAFRARQRSPLDPRNRSDRPLRVAYADPPYPGKAELYRDQPTFAGEVDHRELIARLRTYDGWALSTSADALRRVLPLCPEGVRVCAWGKTDGVPEATYGMHKLWEPIIVWPARRMRPGFPDWIRAQHARGGDDKLIGRKPLAVCAFIFRAIGMLPGDQLDDLYPGTGIVGRAWAAVAPRSSDGGQLPLSLEGPATQGGDRAQYEPTPPLTSQETR